MSSVLFGHTTDVQKARTSTKLIAYLLWFFDIVYSFLDGWKLK